MNSIKYILAFLLISCSELDQSETPIINGTWKCDYIENGNVFIYLFELSQKDTVVYCNKNSITSVNNYTQEWYFINGYMSGDHIELLFNSSFKYWDLNYRLFLGII